MAVTTCNGFAAAQSKAGEGGSLTYRSHYQFMHEEGVMGPAIGHLDPMPDSGKNSRPGLAARTALFCRRTVFPDSQYHWHPHFSKSPPKQVITFLYIIQIPEYFNFALIA